MTKLLGVLLLAFLGQSSQAATLEGQNQNNQTRSVNVVTIGTTTYLGVVSVSTRPLDINLSTPLPVAISTPLQYNTTLAGAGYSVAVASHMVIPRPFCVPNSMGETLTLTGATHTISPSQNRASLLICNISDLFGLTGNLLVEPAGGGASGGAQIWLRPTQCVDAASDGLVYTDEWHVTSTSSVSGRFSWTALNRSPDGVDQCP